MERDLDEVVSGLYRAASGEGSWSQPLDMIAKTFRARLAVIQRLDLSEQRLLAHESGAGVELEDGVLQYVRHYHLIDPRRAQLVRGIVPVGHWYHDTDHLDDEFMDRDPFYQHFLAAYGSRHLSALTLAPAPDQVVLFGLELAPQRGRLDKDERHLVSRLGVHVGDALRAYERVRRLQAQALAGHQLLQTFQQPMWLIDMDRYVQDANPAAHEEAGKARCLLQRGAHLVASNARMDRELLAGLLELSALGHGASRVLSNEAVGHPPLWLHLTLLRPQEAIGAFGTQVMVLVTMFDPQQVRAFNPFALASLLGLSPAQARVAASLAAGHSPEDIAEAGGTTVATVRSHVHKVLQRTGMQRTEELVTRLQAGHELWTAVDERLKPPK
jgi:DNA-binding CsgD family transcriptional regulator/PAS domain-containing protein